jgi:phosphatidylglycerophosphatase A
VLFRFFDILKPWPIRWCDRRVQGGFGIMLDDLLAGVFSAGLLQIGARWFG